jgi:hypothetical protein
MTINAYVLPYFEALSVVLSKVNITWRQQQPSEQPVTHPNEIA